MVTEIDLVLNVTCYDRHYRTFIKVEFDSIICALQVFTLRSIVPLKIQV